LAKIAVAVIAFDAGGDSEIADRRTAAA